MNYTIESVFASLYMIIIVLLLNDNDYFLSTVNLKSFPFRLPVPWLLYTLGFGVDIRVSSAGLGCSIILLFSMLVAVFLSILLSGWKMSKLLGIAMFFLYFIFVIISLSFEYKWIICPV